jgi:stress response protein YsnF
VFVNRTKDEVKNAPEYDDRRARFDEYVDRLAFYYWAETTPPKPLDCDRAVGVSRPLARGGLVS